MRIAGVVLAGGRSSRYGKPKMFETYKNKYFYQYSIEALRRNSINPIVISTNETLMPFFKEDELEFVIEKGNDEYQGPLFAMYNAFSKIPDSDWYFVLASDLPFVTPYFVKKMMEIAKGNDYDAIIPVHSERPQPLLAIYHRRNLEKMNELLTENNRKLTLLLQDINCLSVEFSTNAAIFTNINSPEDWQRYKD